ncbi:MAG: HXXEE domain-containing protein [Sphingobacteriia bacterium]|nr:HXXEE domain-containing protein [Sphingobacteriia bacterium]
MDAYLVFILSLPVVFMLHDFEEILGLESFIKNGVPKLEKRMPEIAAFITADFKGKTTRDFAKGVMMMFAIVSLSTFVSVISGYYNLWMGVFMAFSLHIVVHILQWIVVRIYVPVIITSLLALPYCVYGIILIINNFDSFDIALWTGIGLIAIAVFLPFAHKVVMR